MSALDKNQFIQSIQTADVWQSPVTFDRKKQLPLDKTSIKETIGDACEYAYKGIHDKLGVAHPGQLVTVLRDLDGVIDGSKYTADTYVIVNPGTEHADPRQASDYLIKLYTSEDTYTKVEVDALLSNTSDPEAMVFRGTLGKEDSTPTITELPEPTNECAGDVYKVIDTQEYTYKSVSQESVTELAKVGDTFVCATIKGDEGDQFGWTRIPSGDEEDTWRSIKVGEVELLGINDKSPVIFKHTPDNPVTIKAGEDAGTIIVEHNEIASVNEGPTTSTSVIKSITIDNFGHITKVEHREETPGFGSISTGDSVIEAVSAGDNLEFKGNGVDITLRAKNTAYIGLTYYEDSSLLSEIGKIDEDTIDLINSIEPVTGEVYSVLTFTEGPDKQFYVRNIENQVLVSHKPKADTLADVTGQLVNGVEFDEFGHVISTSTVDPGEFIQGIVVEGDSTVSPDNGNITITGDDNIEVTPGDSTGTINIKHKLPGERTEAESLTNTGDLISEIDIDKTGHVSKVTRSSVSASTQVEGEGEDQVEFTRLSLGDQKLVDITELSTDVLTQGKQELILDGNFINHTN